MKVLVFGAGGIIGQHMQLCVPPEVSAKFYRLHGSMIHWPLDLLDDDEREEVLELERPNVILNLAGESNTDAVEKDPQGTWGINVGVPMKLAEWCKESNARLIQVSSQAVFSGENPPYDVNAPLDPINAYGRQKAQAEIAVLAAGYQVRRLTFVLGVRPLPHVGRPNPVEQILGGQRKQVNDRWFSPLFARDAARHLWQTITNPQSPQIEQYCYPIKISRYSLALWLAGDRSDGIEAVSHESFPGIAPRPRDTTFAMNGACSSTILADQIRRRLDLRTEYDEKESLRVGERAREIAYFLGTHETIAFARLNRGFLACHAETNQEYRTTNPQTDDDILDWYKQTSSYIWELSAYHCDPQHNYMNMVASIAGRLRDAGYRRVLCLGDGIGDATLALERAGLAAVYHDLEGSRTARFAKFRHWMRTGREQVAVNTPGWAPEIGGGYDAIVSLDFLEHVTDVPAWVRAIREALVVGGRLVAQNAFALGSDGAIPMHLKRNDRYAKEWDPMLKRLGFTQESSNWYIRQ